MPTSVPTLTTTAPLTIVPTHNGQFMARAGGHDLCVRDTPEEAEAVARAYLRTGRFPCTPDPAPRPVGNVVTF